MCIRDRCRTAHSLHRTHRNMNTGPLAGLHLQLLPLNSRLLRTVKFSTEFFMDIYTGTRYREREIQWWTERRELIGSPTGVQHSTAQGWRSGSWNTCITVTKMLLDETEDVPSCTIYIIQGPSRRRAHDTPYVGGSVWYEYYTELCKRLNSKPTAKQFCSETMQHKQHLYYFLLSQVRSLHKWPQFYRGNWHCCNIVGRNNTTWRERVHHRIRC